MNKILGKSASGLISHANLAEYYYKTCQNSEKTLQNKILLDIIITIEDRTNRRGKYPNGWKL